MDWKFPLMRKWFVDSTEVEELDRSWGRIDRSHAVEKDGEVVAGGRLSSRLFRRQVGKGSEIYMQPNQC